MRKYWKVYCRCSLDAWEEVAREFIKQFLGCEIKKQEADEEGEYIEICTYELDYDPREDGIDFCHFVDAVRMLTNFGWPNKDPIISEFICDANGKIICGRDPW